MTIRTFRAGTPSTAARGLAILAAGAFGLAVFTPPAAADQQGWVKQTLENHTSPRSKSSSSGSAEAAPSGGGGYFRCVAAAGVRSGAVFGDTRAVADRDNADEACQVALTACEARLRRKRLFDKRDYPEARCEVSKSEEFAVGPGGYGDLGRDGAN